MVVDIMATHHYVVLKGQIRENSFYIPPEVYLRELIEGTRSTSSATCRESAFKA